MATSVDLGASTYYINGEVIQDGTVGYKDGNRRVLRIPFTTPSVGARYFRFKFDYIYFGNGSSNMPLEETISFYIGTSDDSHKNAGEGSSSHGRIELTSVGSGRWIVSGECNIILAPNTLYYLWFFPNSTLNCYLSWNRRENEAEVDGMAGLVRIDSGNKILITVPYIDDGTKWKQTIPNIDNGNTWNICG